VVLILGLVVVAGLFGVLVYRGYKLMVALPRFAT
jgi:hypothetical protein